MGIILHKLKTIVSADHVSKRKCMRIISIEQLRGRHFKNRLILYTEQEKCSYKPLLKEKIHDLMQAFQLDTESH